MVKAKKNKTAAPSTAAKAAQTKRHAIAEAACHTIMSTFAHLAETEGFVGFETARQYAQMAGVYYRKIRNGKIISPADFNLAVDVCTAARRALLALDADLQFANRPDGEALREAVRLAESVLQEYRALTGKG